MDTATIPLYRVIALFASKEIFNLWLLEDADAHPDLRTILPDSIEELIKLYRKAYLQRDSPTAVYYELSRLRYETLSALVAGGVARMFPSDVPNPSLRPAASSAALRGVLSQPLSPDTIFSDVYANPTPPSPSAEHDFHDDKASRDDLVHQRSQDGFLGPSWKSQPDLETSSALSNDYREITEVTGRSFWHPATANAEADIPGWLTAVGTNRDGQWNPGVLEFAVKFVTSNDIQTIDRLLRDGVSVHERPDNGSRPGETLLEIACGPQSYARTFEKLLDFAVPERLNEVDNKFQGLIHRLKVYSEQRDRKLEALLNKGADPNLMCWGQYPVLVSYILENQHNASMILLDNGADPTQASRDGVNAIHAASSTGNVAILERIKSIVPPDFNWGCTCQASIAVNCPDDRTVVRNYDAINLAAINGFESVIRFCSDLGVDVNYAMADSLDRPIHSAASSGSVRCIRALHERGADLTAQLAEGMTALHLAVLENHAPAVRTLLELAGGSLNEIRDKMGVTPFEYAYGFGHRDTVGAFTDGQFFKLEPINAGRPRISET